MKKPLFTSVVLGALAATAHAESSVTMWGIIDLSANYIKNGDARSKSLQSNELNSSRLGFRGVEDLGGGLKAGFWLEAGVTGESGVAGGSNGVATAFFNRRSTVSLSSDSWGEIRLGRDYVPTFWNIGYDEANGANGLGTSLNFINTFGTLGSGAITMVRDNNTIAYHLPGNLNGLYGQVTVAAGEGVPGQKYWGGRLGWGKGPADVNAAYGVTKTASDNDFKVWNLGGSYNFGVLKLFGLYNRTSWIGLKQAVYEVSMSVPMGPGEFRAGYLHADASGRTPAGTNVDANDANLYSVGYIYNLSKRTALYTTAARINNKGAATYSVLGAAPSRNLAGNSSTGFNIGLRHSF